MLYTFRRQPLGRFADTYNIVYMTFKAIHMLIAEVEKSSNGPPEYNRRRHDFKVAGRSRAAASRRSVNAVITTLRQELTRIKSGDMGCQESVSQESSPQVTRSSEGDSDERGDFSLKMWQSTDHITLCIPIPFSRSMFPRPYA